MRLIRVNLLVVSIIVGMQWQLKGIVQQRKCEEGGEEDQDCIICNELLDVESPSMSS